MTKARLRWLQWARRQVDQRRTDGPIGQCIQVSAALSVQVLDPDTGQAVHLRG